VCKSDRKRPSTRRSRRSQGRDNYKSKGIIQSELVFATFAISVCKSDQERPSTRRSRRSQRKGQLQIEGDHQSELVFAISVCKSDQKRPSTRRSQRSQRNGQSRIEGPSNANWSLRPLRSLCVNPIRKGHPHGDRKDHKGTDNYESKGSSIRIGLCDLDVRSGAPLRARRSWWTIPRVETLG
jgi:hypothetical protein